MLAFATSNLQLATRNLQLATCNSQLATRNSQLALYLVPLQSMIYMLQYNMLFKYVKKSELLLKQ